MLNRSLHPVALLAAVTLAIIPAACSGAANMDHPNSIQPETTLSITSEATIERVPDIAFVNLGVVEKADSAKAAMAANAKAMKQVFKELKRNDIEEKDVQTSNFSVSPLYKWVQTPNEGGGETGEQIIDGYIASNQVSVRVDVGKLGDVLDDLVEAGGNTFSGVSFALSDDSTVMNEARTQAMTDARSRAELYADAAGLKVHRIVTINEGGTWNRGPQPMTQMAMRSEGASMATPIAGGEVGYTANVSVTFELK